MKKQFIIESPEKIPPKSEKSAFGCSDMYFGLATNYEGEEIKVLVCYDFTEKEWLFISGFGKKKLIEYYIEK